MMIEKGVPFVCGRARANAARTKYPWAEMEVGDSFLAPSDKTLNAMSTACSYHSRKSGRTFRASTTPEGIRVHRLA